MPRVAALLDVQQISDVTKIESEDSALPEYRRFFGVLTNGLQPSFDQYMPEMQFLRCNHQTKLK